MEGLLKKWVAEKLSLPRFMTLSKQGVKNLQRIQKYFGLIVPVQEIVCAVLSDRSKIDDTWTQIRARVALCGFSALRLLRFLLTY